MISARDVSRRIEAVLARVVGARVRAMLFVMTAWARAVAATRVGAAALVAGVSAALAVAAVALAVTVVRAALVALAVTGVGAVSVARAATASPATAAAANLLISPEDVIMVHAGSPASAPSINGSIQPRLRADLRAEVAAVVLQVLKENGDAVRRGDVLVRLDDTAIRDGLSSAQIAVRTAGLGYEQAERQLQRLKALSEAGVASVIDAEDAEIRRNNAQSALEAAKSNAALARQQLQRTMVRAPFDGIVSNRQVSAGDTAQIGKELLYVIDPRSMRFEGRVSADAIGRVKAGQRVVFNVHGYGDQAFIGRVAQVSPAADAVSRQVEVLVDFAPGAQQPTVSGLYADGRIETSDAAVLTIPATAVMREGDAAFAWRLRGTQLQKVPLALGERDARSGEFVLARVAAAGAANGAAGGEVSGLADGDRVLRYPSAALRDGQRFEWARDSAAGVR